MQPIISVVIPTYNRSRLVVDCVQSILDSGIAGVEVIVADDGSTDDTGDALRAFAPRVKHLWRRNAGPAAARNAGFAISTGEFITFLDSDDQWIAPGMSRLIDVLSRYPHLPLVFGDTRLGNATDGYRSFVETYGRTEFPRLPSRTIEPGLRRLDAKAFLRLLARRNVVFLGSLVMRRGVFERSGGFDPALCGAADWEFFMRLAAEHEFAYAEQTPASNYLTHPGCMSHDGDGMAEDFIRALDAVRRTAHLSAGDRAVIERELARHRFDWAYAAYDRGDLAVARERFARSRTDDGYRLKAQLYWLLSHLLPGSVQRVRSLKRAITG